MAKRYRCGNLCAGAGRSLKLQRPAELLYPFLHIAQAQATRCVVFRDSQSVIRNHQRRTLAVPAQVYLDFGGAGMAFDIGQRFLGNTVQRDFGVVVQ